MLVRVRLIPLFIYNLFPWNELLTCFDSTMRLLPSPFPLCISLFSLYCARGYFKPLIPSLLSVVYGFQNIPFFSEIIEELPLHNHRIPHEKLALNGFIMRRKLNRFVCSLWNNSLTIEHLRIFFVRKAFIRESTNVPNFSSPLLCCRLVSCFAFFVVSRLIGSHACRPSSLWPFVLLTPFCISLTTPSHVFQRLSPLTLFPLSRLAWSACLMHLHVLVIRWLLDSAYPSS